MKRALLLVLGLSAPAAAQVEGESWLEAELRRFRTYPHLDRAYRRIQAGDLDEARVELRRVLELDPAAVEARLAFVDLSYRLGDYEETEREAGLLLERFPGRVEPLLYRGLARIRLRRIEGALEDFRAVHRARGAGPADRTFAITAYADLAIERSDCSSALEALDAMPAPGRDEGYFARRGQCLDALGRLAEAEAAFGHALDRAEGPRRADRFRALGEVRKKRRNWAGAREAFLAALELDPDHGRDDVDLLRSVGEVAYQQEDFEEAARWMARVVSVGSDPRDREFLAHLYWMTGERERALAELERLRTEVRLPVDRMRVLSTLAEALTDAGRLDDAVKAYREVLELGSTPSAETHFRLGLLYTRIGDDEQALEELELAESIGLGEGALPGARAQQGALYARLGRHDDALLTFEEALRLEPDDPFVKRSLALAYERADRLEEAAGLYEELLAASPGDASVLAALGHLETKRGRYAEAADLFERASEGERTPDVLLLASWGEALFLSERWEEAARVFHRLLASPGVAEGRRAETLERLGYLYVAQGDDVEAAFYLESAVEAGRDHAGVRENLGLVLYRLGRFREALDELLLALAQEKREASLVYAARCLKELDRPGLAIHYLEEALPGIDRFDRDERRVIYNELGFLYAHEEENGRAAEAWARSLDLRYDAEIALRRGRAMRSSGRYDEALVVLQGIDPDALSREKAGELLDELSLSYGGLGRPEDAIDAAERAGTTAPSADRFYRVGLLLREESRFTEAASFFRSAVVEEPETPRYAEALGFALDEIGSTEEAIARFEWVVGRDPDYLELYPQLGYLYMRKPDNEAARKWFELAIDNEPLYPVAGADEEEELARDVFHFRREVAKLTNELDVGLYTSLRSDSGAPPPAVFGPSALPSQGGVELAYQPPRWGLRDERIFQAFVRVLWNHETESLLWDPESLQGGAGVRYKPLRAHNLRASFERLFRIGENAQDNWLARGLYSFESGYDLKPGVPSWSYTLLHGEAGYLLEAPRTRALYAEGRKGWTFNVSDSFLVTPHVVVAGREESPATPKGTYVEAGPGVSLKLLFREGRYHAHRSSFEILVQYRSGKFRNDSSFSGWVVVGSVQF